jgi:hypothetical protein
MTGKDLKSKEKNQKQTHDTVDDYLYRNTGGKLAQPSTHIIGALKKAGARFQISGQGKQTYKNLLGSGAVIISPDMIPHELQSYVIDRRPVVVQRSRIVRSRPRLDKWALSFEVDFDENEIPGSVLKEVFDYAGRRVGIGDFRPACGGPFGRFIVSKFE